jgi:hypothetical protein
LEEKKREAKEQIEKYLSDRKIIDDNNKPLKKMTVITIGKNDLVYEELN